MTPWPESNVFTNFVLFHELTRGLEKETSPAEPSGQWVSRMRHPIRGRYQKWTQLVTEPDSDQYHPEMEDRTFIEQDPFLNKLYTY